jgi:hypothetical protein
MPFRMNKRDVVRGIATVLISLIVFSIVGITYVSSALDENNGALCEIIVTSAIPLPKPPPNAPGQPGPETPYGKALSAYNEALNQRATLIQQSRVRAIKRYHCPPLAELPGR